MGDASYDAVIIGGGTKALILAMYLTKYGGLEVAIFERKYEVGGGWCSDEGAAPGFIADYHVSSTSTSYHIPIEWDFPEWLELGGGYIEVKTGSVAIFKEDDSYIVMYSIKEDPSQGRTAESIAKFSGRDAETRVGRIARLTKAFTPALLEWVYNPPPPPGEPDALDKLFSAPSSGSILRRDGKQDLRWLGICLRVRL